MQICTMENICMKSYLSFTHLVANDNESSTFTKMTFERREIPKIHFGERTRDGQLKVLAVSESERSAAKCDAKHVVVVVASVVVVIVRGSQESRHSTCKPMRRICFITIIIAVNTPADCVESSSSMPNYCIVLQKRHTRFAAHVAHIVTWLHTR